MTAREQSFLAALLKDVIDYPEEYVRLARDGERLDSLVKTTAASIREKLGINW
jgi:hypothetical protein